MRIAAITALALACTFAHAQQFNGYNNAQLPLTGTERWAAAQGDVTVNITPAMIQGFLFPSGALSVPDGGTGITSITGPIRGNGSAPFSPAAASDIISLWSGANNSSCWLRGDGNCVTPPGGGTLTPTGTVTTNTIAAWASGTTLTNATGPEVVSLFTGTCTPSATIFLATNGTCQAGTAAGTVTSVGLAVPGSSIFGLTGTNPITASGTITLTTAGTSGGMPYFSSTSVLKSSAALTANQLMVGGGAGNPPIPIGSLGALTTVLHGNPSGPPSYGLVNLSTDATGVNLPGTGGTGVVNANTLTLTGGNATFAAAPSGRIAPLELPLCTVGSNAAAQACPLTGSTTLTAGAFGQMITVNCGTTCTITIPSNASVPYALGTSLPFYVYPGSSIVTVAINSDTMTLVNSGTSPLTGSRSLPANTLMTVYKYATTAWFASANGAN